MVQLQHADERRMRVVFHGAQAHWTVRPLADDDGLAQILSCAVDENRRFG